MNLHITLFLLSAIPFATAADSIQVTAQCTGAPVQEAARSIVTPTAILPLADGSTEPVRILIRQGHPATLELSREFRYPTVLAFDKVPSKPIEMKQFVTKNTGLTVALTAAREGDQIVFHGACTLRRPASTMTADPATPKDQPCVTSASFITRECDFAGRAPLDVPAKVNLGEQGIDVGELVLTFSNVSDILDSNASPGEVSYTFTASAADSFRAGLKPASAAELKRYRDPDKLQRDGYTFYSANGFVLAVNWESRHVRSVLAVPNK